MKANQAAQKAATSDRIRAAVEKNPRRMTLQLARDLGVPEVEIIRAFPPPDRVMELDIARWKELIRSLEALRPGVWVLVSNEVLRRLRLTGNLAASARQANSSTCRPTRSTCTFDRSNWQRCSPWRSQGTWTAWRLEASSSSIRWVPPRSRSSSTSAGRSCVFEREAIFVELRERFKRHYRQQ